LAGLTTEELYHTTFFLSKTTESYHLYETIFIIKLHEDLLVSFKTNFFKEIA